MCLERKTGSSTTMLAYSVSPTKQQGELLQPMLKTRTQTGFGSRTQTGFGSRTQTRFGSRTQTVAMLKRYVVSRMLACLVLDKTFECYSGKNTYDCDDTTCVPLAVVH